MKLGLIKGRHEMPVDEYIFDEIENPLDFAGMMNAAYKKFQELFPEGTLKHVRAADTDARDYFSGHIDIYVTGLTSATLAVYNAAALIGLDVTFWHFNRETSEYVPQVMYSRFL